MWYEQATVNDIYADLKLILQLNIKFRYSIGNIINIKQKKEEVPIQIPVEHQR